jgi:prophage antirepressor-like protein
LEDDEHLTLPLVRAGQSRTVNVVNESGLYALIFQSRKPVAKKFRKWVTSDVLPAIRKTGYYSTTPFPQSHLSECIILACTDVCGQTRQMYLYYNVSNDWFQEIPIDCANLIQGCMKQLGKMDKKVVGIKTEWQRLRNGKYEPSTIMFPAWSKEAYKPADPIAQCERAISDYNRARERVKEAAGRVVNHIHS